MVIAQTVVPVFVLCNFMVFAFSLAGFANQGLPIPNLDGWRFIKPSLTLGKVHVTLEMSSSIDT